MRAKTNNRHLARDHDLAGNARVRIPALRTFEVLDHLYRVLPRPPAHREESVETVRVRARVGVPYHLSTPAVSGCVRHSPFDLPRLERFFERGDDLRQLVVTVSPGWRAELRACKFGMGSIPDC